MVCCHSSSKAYHGKLSNPFFLLFPLIPLVLLGTALAVTSPSPEDLSWRDSLSAAACARDRTLFDASSPEALASEYHGTVDAIIEEYLSLSDSADFDCTSATLYPTEQQSQLSLLARRMVPWLGSPEAVITREHLAPVLRRYLEAYECWLTEYRYAAYSKGEFPTITRELTVARPALERALSILESAVPFDSLDRELQCFLRASLDLKTALGITASASSCTPLRLRHQFDVLRDLLPEP